MNIRYALAEFVQMMIGAIVDNAGVGFFVVPLLTLRWIIRFLRWGIAVARGGDNLEEMQTEWGQQQQRISRAPDRARSSFRRRF